MKKIMKTLMGTTAVMALVLSTSTTTYAAVKPAQHQVHTRTVKTVSLAQQQARTMGSLSGVLPWYENTGTSIPEGHTPDYSQYNLLSVAQKGDIIYESKGGYGITGHCAIVEGKFYDEPTGQWYIRMIESTAPGTIRGILEETCVNKWDVHLLRVPNATKEQIDGAVDFCIGQLGTTYNLDFAHDYSADEKDWYCSELVWAAYYNQGIDIETKGILNEPGITPRDIYRNKNLTEINFK